MSFESEPVRGSRPVVRRRRRRGALVPTLIVLGALIVLALVLAGVWTDVLWYDQLGYLSVYRTQVLSQIVLFLLGGLIMAGAVLACLVLAYRSRPVYVPTANESSGIERYREALEPLRRLVVLAVPIVLGLFAGSAVAGQWQTVLLWWNGVPFGTQRPAVRPRRRLLRLHPAVPRVPRRVPHGGRRAGGDRERRRALPLRRPAAAGPGAARHARARGCTCRCSPRRSCSCAAVDYWLGRYDLATADSGRITGLSYTDAHATLTAKGILAGIAVIVAVLFLVSAFVGRLVAAAAALRRRRRCSCRRSSSAASTRPPSSGSR